MPNNKTSATREYDDGTLKRKSLVLGLFFGYVAAGLFSVSASAVVSPMGLGGEVVAAVYLVPAPIAKFDTKRFAGFPVRKKRV